MYSRERLEEYKLDWQSLDTKRSLVCGSDKRNCICVDALDRGESCITYERAVARFRKALLHPGEGRSVTCDLAETGVCGAYRYFLFRGDIYRDEVMWFTAEGRLVGIRFQTDYNQCCEHGARTEVSGDIPDCDRMETRTRICGEGPSPSIPVQDFRHLVTPNAP